MNIQLTKTVIKEDKRSPKYVLVTRSLRWLDNRCLRIDTHRDKHRHTHTGTHVDTERQKQTRTDTHTHTDTNIHEQMHTDSHKLTYTDAHRHAQPHRHTTRHKQTHTDTRTQTRHTQTCKRAFEFVTADVMRSRSLGQIHSNYGQTEPPGQHLRMRGVSLRRSDCFRIEK